MSTLTFNSEISRLHDPKDLTLDVVSSSLSRVSRPGGATLREGQLVYDSTADTNHSNATISYGPYISLNRGKYKLQLVGRLEGDFNIKLTADCGETLLKEKTISSIDDTITFSVEDVMNFEVVISRLPRSKILA